MPPDPSPLPGDSTNPIQNLFRRQALDHFLNEQELREPLRVSPPWTWALFLLMGGLFLTGLLLAVFGKVDQLERGKGILRPTAGVRLIQSPLGGTLIEIAARSGDPLRAGQLIARIDASQVAGAKVESEQRLKLLQKEGREATEQETQQLQQQLAALRSRLRHQEDQVASFDQSVLLAQRKLDSNRKLQQSGLIAGITVDEAQESVNAAIRQRDQARQGLAQLRQEASGIEAQLTRSGWKRTQEVSDAQIKVESLQGEIDKTRLLAPVDGYLEALVSRQGDLLQPGQTVAKIVPSNSPLVVVSFVAEKDRAFLSQGDEVYLELDAYPYTEFGTLKGRIARIGSDLVAPHEVREAFGEDAKLEAPSYRLELELLPGRPDRLASVTLRPGMLLQARYRLRKRRVIALLFAPLRRWLD